MPETTPAQVIDREQLAKNLATIHQEVMNEANPEADLRHLKKMQIWGSYLYLARVCHSLDYP